MGVVRIVSKRLAFRSLKLLAEVPAAGLIALKGVETQQLTEFEEVRDPSRIFKRLIQVLDAFDHVLVLCDRFAILHTTVQFEHVGCAVSESGCVIPSGSHAQHQH